MKRTKIVATIGPASEDKKILRTMIESGLNVARLNFSHNVHEHHAMLIRNIREIAKATKTTVTILQDLQGPRIRIGNVGDGVDAKKGDTIILEYSTKAMKAGSPIVIPIHYERLYKDLKAGSIVLISDALIELVVKKIEGKRIVCEVVRPGLIKTHKGMNFPNATITADPLTKKDLEDVAFGITQRVDYVALSFVKDAADIKRLQQKILALEKKEGIKPVWPDTPRTKIIAKIERIEAVDNFDEILEVVDGIMVARGDLGIELPFEKVPLIQKDMVRKCNIVGKPVIVATQMLESMIQNPIPTRAEVSDVANAILDGADAIMLSGESAGGKYPIESVSAMTRIAREVERMEFKVMQDLESKLRQTRYLVDFISYSAQDIAEKTKVKAILCLTTSGYTARMISRYKSPIPMYAFTHDEQIGRQLNLSWGVKSYTLPFVNSYPKMVTKMQQALKQRGILKVGDTVLICTGQSHGFFDRDNFIKVETVK